MRRSLLLFFAIAGLTACDALLNPSPDELQLGNYDYELHSSQGDAQGLLRITEAGEESVTYRWTVPGFATTTRTAAKQGGEWPLIAFFSENVAAHTVKRSNSGYRCEVQILTGSQTIAGTCSLRFQGDTIATASSP